MSNAVSARIEHLNIPLLRSAETHGRRLDAAAMKRKVREADSLTWVPQGVAGDPLALVDRLEEHVAGHFIPKGGSTRALHMIVKLPDSIRTGTEDEARAALGLAVAFAQDTFGGRAVFSARIDRDERTTNNVDLFIAPTYQKTTKRASKPAVSMTRHLKLLAERHRRTSTEDSARGSMRAQGQALQDELVAWLTARGVAAERGQAKETVGRDQVPPEVLGAKHDREAAEKARQDALEALEAVRARSVALDQREGALRASEAALRKEWVRIEVAKREVATIADKLAAIMQPIKDAVAEWTRSTGIHRQAAERLGRSGSEVLERDDVNQLWALLGKLRGKGR